MLLAAWCLESACLESAANGQTPSAELQLNPAANATAEPIKSTIELRVARRPWLFERLSKPEKAPSTKMQPPRPPAQALDPQAQALDPQTQALGPPAQALGPPAISEPANLLPMTDPSDEFQPLQQPDGWVAREHTDSTSDRLGSRQPPSLTESDSAIQLAPPMERIELDRSPVIAPTDDLPAIVVDSHPPFTEQPESSEPDIEAIEIESEPVPQTGLPMTSTVDRQPAADVHEPTASIGSEMDDVGGTAEDAQRQSDTSVASQSPAVARTTQRRGVEVRELRIDPDGSIREPHPDTAPEGNDSSEQQSTRPAPTKSIATEPVTIGDQRDAMEMKRITIDEQRDMTDDQRDAVDAAPARELDYAGYPLESLPLNNTVRGMQRAMRSCLQHYYARPEVADERSNWGMMHSMMVYGIDTRVIVGRNTYSTIAWIAGNNLCRGQRLLTAGPRGIEAKSGVGLQGHQGQMLAVFAMCNVPEDYPLYAGNQKFSVADIIDAEMATCKSGEELTFALIGLSHYLDTDEVWTADDGQHWDFERLIREELSQPIVGAACGGTHRLMGFAHALRKRRAEGKPIEGQWKRAEKFTQDFESYCYRLQNRDGSMSTIWFEGREDNGNLDRKIQTTGHMVEWLLTITPDSQLQNPRLVQAVRFLLASMYNERDREWKIGPKGHALRSIAMYYERVYRSGPAWRSTSMAHAANSSRR